MKWLKDLPSTNFRIVMTMLIMAGTAIKYWVSNVPPDGQWLVALCTLAGIDGSIILGKRLSAKPEIIAAEADADVRRTEAAKNAAPPLTPKEADAIAHRTGE